MCGGEVGWSGLYETFSGDYWMFRCIDEREKCSAVFRNSLALQFHMDI